jgi:hypothetical protein
MLPFLWMGTSTALQGRHPPHDRHISHLGGLDPIMIRLVIDHCTHQ